MKINFKKARINWKGKVFEGVLMPYEDKDSYILKLSNGYNIGIPKNESTLEIIGEETLSYEEKLSKEGEITVIGCGGTISSRVDYNTGAVIPSMNFSAFEGIKKKIKAIELFKIFSEEFTTEHWKELSKTIYEEAKNENPVIVLHGTDTMHYSSAAVAFSIPSLNIPVIFTGAQRSVDRPSSDAKENVLNSIFSSTQNFGEVVVLMHSSINDGSAYIHRGVKVRKLHTSRRDAFQSVNIKPLAEVNYEENKFKLIEKLYPLRSPSPLSKLENHFNENVAILYYYPGMPPSLISKYSEFEGIVIAGTGLGHVSLGVNNDRRIKPVYKELKELIDSDVKIVMVSQTIHGRINMNVYSTGRKLLELGVIGNYTDMTIETAFVKLSWVLGKEKRYSKVKELMETNLVGEITERSEYL